MLMIVASMLAAAVTAPARRDSSRRRRCAFTLDGTASRHGNRVKAIYHAAAWLIAVAWIWLTGASAGLLWSDCGTYASPWSRARDPRTKHGPRRGRGTGRLTAAASCSRRRRRLRRRPRDLPRDKTCGDALSNDTVATLDRLGLGLRSRRCRRRAPRGGGLPDGSEVTRDYDPPG